MDRTSDHKRLFREDSGGKGPDFKGVFMKTVGQVGEGALLRWLQDTLLDTSPHVIRTVGDDAAVLRLSPRMVQVVISKLVLVWVMLEHTAVLPIF